MIAMVISTVCSVLLTLMCGFALYIMIKQQQRNSRIGKERLEDIIVNDLKTVKRNVVACQIFAQQTEQGENIFTNAFIDFERYELTAFCIPVNEEGGEEKDLVKLFLIDLYSLEQKEYIVKYDNDYIVDLLSKFTKQNGNS